MFGGKCIFFYILQFKYIYIFFMILYIYVNIYMFFFHHPIQDSLGILKWQNLVEPLPKHRFWRYIDSIFRKKHKTHFYQLKNTPPGKWTAGTWKSPVWRGKSSSETSFWIQHVNFQYCRVRAFFCWVLNLFHCCHIWIYIRPNPSLNHTKSSPWNRKKQGALVAAIRSLKYRTWVQWKHCMRSHQEEESFTY